MGRVSGNDGQLRNSGQDINGSLRVRRQKPFVNMKNSPRVKKVVGGLSPDTLPGVRGPWASRLDLNGFHWGAIRLLRGICLGRLTICL